jgi:hypothetical protein
MPIPGDAGRKRPPVTSRAQDQVGKTDPIGNEAISATAHTRISAAVLMVSGTAKQSAIAG